ncbi:hypothetical protein THAR02_11244 [Trichoderma harzianum]|uniref:Uncharacterized protein n=1 Tax=Trichoderma harzianum TaxID=5544 RepID=A0A0F9WW04_TRIHA|nr:hypothetical protein THAR02_11244 [Trichoderma harzianum]
MRYLEVADFTGNTAVDAVFKAVEVRRAFFSVQTALPPIEIKEALKAIDSSYDDFLAEEGDQVDPTSPEMICIDNDAALGKRSHFDFEDANSNAHPEQPPRRPQTSDHTATTEGDNSLEPQARRDQSAPLYPQEKETLRGSPRDRQHAFPQLQQSKAECIFSGPKEATLNTEVKPPTKDKIMNQIKEINAQQWARQDVILNLAAAIDTCLA